MKIVFLGGGNMATALVGGLIKQGAAPASIQVIEKAAENRQRLAQEFGVECLAAADRASLHCDIIVLAVKPQQMSAAVAPLAGKLNSQLVVSIAAGLRLADIRRWLGGYKRLVRAMPNTPALIGAGVTGLYAASSVSKSERQAAESVLAAVGSTLWVDDEGMMDAVTAISGSGPAYVFYFIAALQQAAVQLGFGVEQARRLSLDTFLGAVRLAEQSGEDVAVLRDRVTSKGGTTEAALVAMDANDVAAAITRAVQAAQARGRELGDQLGRD
jgi:pyrroline-5-carboxylate reductase